MISGRNVLGVIIVCLSCQGVNQTQQTGTGDDTELQSVILNDPEDKTSGVLVGTANGSRVIISSQQFSTEDEALGSMNLKGANITSVNDGFKIVFETDVMFGKNSSELTKTAKQNLNQLVKTLRKSNSKLTIDGYSDNTGTQEYNKKLSQQRAQSVADFLKKKNITANRMVVTGYGDARPLYANETEKGKQQNRRVEIKVTR